MRDRDQARQQRSALIDSYLCTSLDRLQARRYVDDIVKDSGCTYRDLVRKDLDLERDVYLVKHDSTCQPMPFGEALALAAYWASQGREWEIKGP